MAVLASALVGLRYLPAMVQLGEVPPLELLIVAVLAGVLVHRLPRAPVSWSVAGTVPLVELTALLVLVPDLPELLPIVVLTVVLGLILSWPGRIATLWRLSPSRIWPQWTRAAAVNALLLAFTTWMAGDWLELALLFTVVAVGWDLVDEVRARRTGPLLVAWELHRVYAVPVALRALEKEGIEAHLRGYHLRSLLHFFGPYVPVEVLVAPDQAQRAAEIVRERLGVEARPAPDQAPMADAPVGEGAERRDEVLENPWKPL